MKTGAILFIEDYYLDKEPSLILRELGKDYIAWDDLPTKEGKDSPLRSSKAGSHHTTPFILF